MASIALAALLTAFVGAPAAAQTSAARPERGLTPGGAYSVSDFESVSLTGGNVNLSIPLASLPPVAGGRLSFTLSAVYNSKLWDVARKEVRVSGIGYRTYAVDNPRPSDLGGWRLAGSYSVAIRNATEDYEYVPPTSQSETSPADWNNMQNQWYKAVLVTPDGAEHELRPVDGSGAYQPSSRERLYLNGYHSRTPYTTGQPMRYYTYDGTYLSVVIYPSGSATRWVVYRADGTRVEGYDAQQTGGVTQQMIDANGNSIKFFTDAQGVYHVQDERTGRGIKVSSAGPSVTRVSYQTVGGVWQHVDVHSGTTTVRGKTYRVSDWNPDGGETPEGAECRKHVMLNQRELTVIRRIVFPATEPGLPGREFSFAYNSDAAETVTTESVQWECYLGLSTHTREASRGMGALSRVVTPSGAVVEYDYTLAARHDFGDNPDEMVEETLVTKRLVHEDADAPGGLVTDTWTYEINPRLGAGTVNGPHGSRDLEVSFPSDPRWGPYAAQTVSKSGLTYRSVRSGKVMTERRWALMPFAGADTSRTGAVSPYPVNFNPVVEAEFTTLLEPDSAGTPVPVRMSAKKFRYDYNGNLLETKEYDWFDPELVAGMRDGAGVPTDVPGGLEPLRTVTNAYHHEAGIDASADVYAKRALPQGGSYFLNAVKQTTAGAAVTKISYDGQSFGAAPTRGNPTKVEQWDSATGTWIETKATYDPTYGNKETATDANGNVTRYFYEDQTHALPTRVAVDPLNGTGVQEARTTYDYHTGLVTRATDANGNETDIDYTNHLLNAVDPFGRVGTVRGPVDALNNGHRRTVRTFYEDAARVVRTEADLRAQDDGLLKTRTTSDQLGRAVLTEQSEDGVNYTVSTLAQYEQGGRITYASNPHRGTAAATDGWARTTRDAAGRVVEVATFSGRARPGADAACDAANGCTGKVTTTYYAEYTTVKDQAGKEQRSTTDALGRLVRVDELSSAGTLGNEATPAQPTCYTYDALGNLTGVRQGGQWQLHEQRWQCVGGQARKFQYSALSRLTSVESPESGAVQYKYDANGNLVLKIDPRPRPGSLTLSDCSISYTGDRVATCYKYDGVNRVTSRKYNDGTPEVSYLYDSQALPPGAPALTQGQAMKGVLRAVTYGGPASTAGTYYAYDALGRVSSSAQQTDAGGASVHTYTLPEYKYDLAGNLASQTYPSGRVVKTEYDAAGRLAGVRNGEAGPFYAGGAAADADNRIAYAAHGAAAAVRLGNGKWEHTAFNSRLQPTEIGLGASATDSTLLKLEYSYGATAANNELDATRNNGNVRGQKITLPGLTLEQTYTYDELNRLKSAREVKSGSQTWKQTFLYPDVFGNRRTDTGNEADGSAKTTTPVAENPNFSPATNRITDAGYVYDAAGNLTVKPGFVYGYDADNRIKSADDGQPSGVSTYTYDGDGRRVRKVTGSGMAVTICVYDAFGKLVAEYAGAPPQQNGTRYLTADHLGSPRIITDSAGNVSARHDYLPFGEELSANDQDASVPRKTAQGYVGDGIRQKFAGTEREAETGLDFMQARYYSARTGRFMSVDPIFFQKEMLIDPQRLNQYSYVRNNPLKFVDPMGEAIELVGDEEQRRKILELLRKAVGKEAGAYLYENKGEDGKYYVGIYTNGPDGKGKSFAEINSLAAGFSLVITDARVARVQLAGEGSRAYGYQPYDRATISGVAEWEPPIPFTQARGPAITFISSYQETTTFLLDPDNKYPGIPHFLMENFRTGLDSEASDILAHEIGHVAAKWGLLAGRHNQVAVAFENTARRLRNPNAVLRTGHNNADDAKPDNLLNIRPFKSKPSP